MTARDFCYWLQGYFEVLHAGKFPPEAAAALKGLSGEQADVIRRHLALVFAHDIDPKAGGAGAQEKLNAIHGAVFKTPGDAIARC